MKLKKLMRLMRLRRLRKMRRFLPGNYWFDILPLNPEKASSRTQQLSAAACHSRGLTRAAHRAF